MSEALQHEAEAPEDDVVIIEEAPKPERRKPVIEGIDPEDADYGTKVQKRIAQLASQRRAAEAKQREAEARATRLERELSETRSQRIKEASEAIDTQLATAQSQHQRAFAEGDADKLTRAATEMAQLEARRIALAQAKQQTQQQPAPQRYTPKTQAYIDQNAWFESDPEARDVAIAADAAARRRGIVTDTPEYFEFVTKRVKTLFPHHFEDGEDEDPEDEPEPAQRRAAAPVARAQRTAPNAPAPRASRLPSLTAEEASMAEKMGLTPQEYAREKAKIMVRK